MVTESYFSVLEIGAFEKKMDEELKFAASLLRLSQYFIQRQKCEKI